jgi:hypothetical protein
MATITGPKIQMPTSLSQMFTFDEQGNITGLRQEWAQFFHAIEGILNAETKSGPTASRPTTSMQFRFVGMRFFDTTLGKPVFLKTASSSAWVDATGAPA